MTSNFHPFAIWPPPGSPVYVTTWLREIAALSKCIPSPPPYPDDAARGQGQPVIVVPGFCSPDATTARLREFLTRQGFAPRTWDCGPNLDPTRTVLSTFERQLVETADRTGRLVSLVGINQKMRQHSREPPAKKRGPYKKKAA